MKLLKVELLSKGFCFLATLDNGNKHKLYVTITPWYGKYRMCIEKTGLYDSTFHGVIESSDELVVGEEIKKYIETEINFNKLNRLT